MYFTSDFPCEARHSFHDAAIGAGPTTCYITHWGCFSLLSNHIHPSSKSKEIACISSVKWYAAMEPPPPRATGQSLMATHAQRYFFSTLTCFWFATTYL